jgi:hypothetical protein
MPYAAVPLRFTRVVSWRAEACVMWDGECGGTGLHAAREVYATGEGRPDGLTTPPGWDALHPGACDDCGARMPADAKHSHSGSLRSVYDTPSGRPEPGCAFWSREHGDRPCFHWDNCPGRHLMVVLPNGHQWDVDSRASNCGRPDDRTHRCWVRVGDPERPETLHVSKDGDTCAAGAGSIVAGDYHGFLSHGTLTAG